jgi:nucleoporin POM152
LRAIFSLTGEAPYKISYSVTHGSGRPTEYTKTIRSGSRDELELRPEQTGEFTYEFISLQDKNYDSIPIGKTVKQVVHPLAGVKFVNPGKERSFWSCDGEAAADKTIKVPIELKGTAPWTLEYRILGNKQPFTVAEITQAKLNLDVPIPSKVLKNGGSFTVSIVSVKDGRGCSQPMTVEDLVVNVVKSSPTAAFANTNRNQDITVKQGEQVQLPLRLPGEGVCTRYMFRNLELNISVAVSSHGKSRISTRQTSHEPLLSKQRTASFSSIKRVHTPFSPSQMHTVLAQLPPHALPIRYHGSKGPL